MASPTANELHVPVSDPKAPTPTFLKLSSADVIHSFWVPRLAGKTDMIPARVNEMWIDPYKPGVYLGQCNQYCGTEHAKMLLRVYVQPRAEFDAWARNQQKAAADVAEAEGRPRCLRVAVLYQLPRGERHDRKWTLWSGPDPLDES